VKLNGQVVGGHVYNSVTVDGDFGLLAIGAPATFDDVRIKSDDPAFVETSGSNLLAAEAALMTDRASTLTQAELDAVAVTAMSEWIDTLGDGDPRLAGFGSVRITTADLAGDALGYAEGLSIWIDSNAAGYGWSGQGGSMDLVTVVGHELGHVLGFGHDAEHAVMDERLAPAVDRRPEGDRFEAAPEASISRLKFDLEAGTGAPQPVEWQPAWQGGWTLSYSPFAVPRDPPGPSGNFSDFLVRLAAGGAQSGQGALEFDSLGRSLLGTKSAGKGAAKR
jgi:hypothetical protein